MSCLPLGAEMPEPRRVIELEPKNPFRWSVVLGVAVLWLVLLGLGVVLKNRVLLLLWPALLFILVVYLGICTIVLLKNKR